jgi:hypothetical protein
MKRRMVARLAWSFGLGGILLMAGTGTAFAVPVPEMDPGSAGSGIALAIGAALLIVERYRSRR